MFKADYDTRLSQFGSGIENRKIANGNSSMNVAVDVIIVQFGIINSGEHCNLCLRQ